MIADHDVRYVRLKTNESKQTHTHTHARNEIINLILTSQRKVTYSRENINQASTTAVELEL